MKFLNACDCACASVDFRSIRCPFFYFEMSIYIYITFKTSLLFSKSFDCVMVFKLQIIRSIFYLFLNFVFVCLFVCLFVCFVSYCYWYIILIDAHIHTHTYNTHTYIYIYLNFMYKIHTQTRIYIDIYCTFHIQAFFFV